MKKQFKRLLSTLCAAALMLGLMPLGALAATPEHTLWIVGDSTGCDYAADTDGNYFYKRCGFGTALKGYVDGTYEVKNLAVSGRSSKSFPIESKANYDALTAGIKAGDTLLIAFGHNDQKTDEAHYTAPNGTSTTEGSFAKSLTDLYIKVAQDKSATPILCTPIVRRTDSTSWGADKLHQANGGDYAEDIRKLGAELSVPVVDMTTLTKEKYDAVGTEESKNFHAWLANKNVDNTHLNAYGAQVVAQILAGEIAKLTSLDIAGHIDSAKVAASLDKATLLVQNPGWVDPATLPYSPPDTQSTQCDPYVASAKAAFYGTAMGDLAGSASATNHVRETTADGKMRIAVLNGKSKISSTADGLVMYYYQVPADKPFALKAKGHVNSINTEVSNLNQGGFGLMARDDMYIDKSSKNDSLTLASDYVTAGCLGDGSGVNFARKGGSLSKNASLSLAKPLAVGQDYELSIVRSVDGNYACSIDGVSMTYDYSIDTIDGAYTYIGMFCARNMDVTYSDITLVVDGKTLCGGAQQPDDPDNPDDPTTVPVEGMIAGGWLESLFAELEGVADADVTAVKWSGAATGALTGADLEYLVRDAGDGVRIDVPGLKAGTYDLTVTIKGRDYVAKGIEVKAHDRSGFAHQTVAEDSTCTPYTEGVGAYKDDGTLKDNAVVLYVTDANKDTVTLTVGSKSLSGIGNILNTAGYRTNGPNGGEAPKILMELSRVNKPLVIRILGTVKAPQGVSAFEQGKSNGSMCYMKYAKNVTIEGIGPDATIHGWGVSFAGDAADATNSNYGKNFEVRNLSFKEVPEDCVEITGKAKNDGSIEEGVSHAWVHNCAFYRPSDILNPAEDDKKQGDGAMDFKSGQYMTMSYNYFERNHKTSLVGAADKVQQYHITWHHNHWKNVESRAPLGRQADMHIYNNFYENQSSYCMSLRGNAYVFSEYNTFKNCKNPVILEATKNESPALPIGACKSYQDDFSGCAGTNQATKVTEKTQQVSATNKYPNFDTASGSYIAKGDYKLDTNDRGMANILAYGGVMKAAAALDTVQFTIEGEDPPVVGPVKVTGVTLNKTSLTLREGATDTLVATVAPDNAADKSVYWISSDTAVVTVDQTGKVTAVKVGRATVTVETTDGKKTATCVVSVTAKDSGGGSGGGSSGGSSSSSKRPSQTITDANGNKITTKTDSKGTKTVTMEAVDGGKVETVTTKNGDVTLTVITPKGEKQVEIKLPATVPAPEEKFTDVPKGHWAESAINTMAGLGVVGGVSQEAAIFDMTSPVTRGSVAVILFRFSNGAVGMTSDFVDVENDAWYADAVGWAADTGVVTGYSNNTFGPKDTITRQQMAVMLSRFARLIGIDTSAEKAALMQFSDGADTGIWAMDGVAWCVKTGILQGKGGNVLDPTAQVSRAEIAVMFNRLITLIK